MPFQPCILFKFKYWSLPPAFLANIKLGLKCLAMDKQSSVFVFFSVNRKGNKLECLCLSSLAYYLQERPEAYLPPSLQILDLD
jgi:hypothetical protein